MYASPTTSPELIVSRFSWATAATYARLSALAVASFFSIASKASMNSKSGLSTSMLQSNSPIFDATPAS